MFAVGNGALQSNRHKRPQTQGVEFDGETTKHSLNLRPAYWSAFQYGNHFPWGIWWTGTKKPIWIKELTQDMRLRATFWQHTEYLINNVPSPKVINWPDRWLENSPFLQQLAILSVKAGGKSKSIYPIDIPLNFPEISLHIKWTSHEILATKQFIKISVDIRVYHLVI